MIRSIAVVAALAAAVPAQALQESPPFFLYSTPVPAVQPPTPVPPVPLPVPAQQPPAPPVPPSGVRSARPTTDRSSTRVAVSGSVSNPAGTVSSTAVSTRNGDASTFVFTRGDDMCGGLAATNEAPGSARFGWQVNVRLLPSSTESPSFGGYAPFLTSFSHDVQVDWKRLWENGRSVTGPVRSARLTLQRGVRMPLDTFASTADSGTCKDATLTLAVGLDDELPSTSANNPADLSKMQETLEELAKQLSEKAAALSKTQATLSDAQRRTAEAALRRDLARVEAELAAVQRTLGRTRPTAVRPVLTGPVVERVNVASRSSRDVEAAMVSARVCAPSTAETPNTVKVIGKDGKCIGTMLDDVDRARLKSAEVDVWLVHTWAGGPAEAQYVKLAVKPLDGSFSFPPMVIESDGRPVNVEVRGYIQLYDGSTGPASTIAVGVGRTVTAADKRVLAAGVSSLEFALPRTSFVPSLELPDDPVLAGHQFSIRVRVVKN